MLRADQRAILAERLLVWKGAPPVNVVADPRALLTWVQHFDDIGTTVFDSIKDLAPALGKDEVGSAIDHALRHLSDADVQVLGLHHLRKAQSDKSSSSSKPRGLDEVYGSTWLTGGSGSVLLLWGEPGDLVVELSTLKPIADPVGPITVVVDPDRGAMSADANVDPETLLRAAGPTGLSALDLVREIGWKGNERAAKERARRLLDRLVEQGVADCEEGSRIAPARWYWTGKACTPACTPARDGDTGARIDSNTQHDEVHAVQNQGEVHESAPASLSPCKGGEAERQQRARQNVHPEDELVDAAKRELDATEIDVHDASDQR
jgi:replicative DNA helicase